MTLTYADKVRIQAAWDAEREAEVDGSPVKYELLPEHLRGGVERWIEHGVRPGGFLCAVLDDSLLGALGHADDTMTIGDLRGIARWFYNHAPQGCFGSPEQTKAWRTMKA